MTEQERSQKARECLRAAKLLCRRALVTPMRAMSPCGWRAAF